MNHPDYPTLTQPKRHIQYECGGGSLSSYYEQGVETQGTKRIKYDTTNHFSGPLPLYPQLDVMVGDASAINDAHQMSWGFDKPMPNGVDVSVLNYEEMLGGLNGYRIHNNTGFDEATVAQYSSHDPSELFGLSGENIDQHSGQAPHGRHEIDLSIAGLSSQVATQHNVGDAQEGRDAGLERGDNPAINAEETGKGETYENQDTMDTSAPVATAMEVDAIEIDGEVIMPMDTNIALGMNQS